MACGHRTIRLPLLQNARSVRSTSVCMRLWVKGWVKGWVDDGSLYIYTNLTLSHEDVFMFHGYVCMCACCWCMCCLCMRLHGRMCTLLLFGCVIFYLYTFVVRAVICASNQYVNANLLHRVICMCKG